MKWLELSVESSPEYVEPLCYVLSQHGEFGVVIEEEGGYNPDEGEEPSGDGRVFIRTYIPLESFSETLRNNIDLGVRLVAHFSPISVLTERVMEEEDWIKSWKDNFQVLQIGENVVVVPSWREYAPKNNDVLIKLDPGMAFGTGHHPTTRMCLELMEKLVRPGMSVLDVGCGSAILSIAAAGMGASRVIGVEIDPAVAKVALANVEANGINSTVKVLEGTLDRVDLGPNHFDVAVANISAKVVLDISADIAAVIKPGGKFIISGILEKAVDDVKHCVSDAGGRIGMYRDSGDWVALVVST